MPGGKSGRDTHHCTSFSGLTLEQATHLVWCAWVNLVRQCAPQVQLHFNHLFLGGGRRKMSRWEPQQKASWPGSQRQVILLHHLQGEGGEETMTASPVLSVLQYRTANTAANQLLQLFMFYTSCMKYISYHLYLFDFGCLPV